MIVTLLFWHNMLRIKCFYNVNSYQIYATTVLLHQGKTTAFEDIGNRFFKHNAKGEVSREGTKKPM